MQTYDVLVLGGGTAGTAAAKAAAGVGARTAMFNDGELGGLCILRGCMPTKTMLHAAHLAHTAHHNRTSGVTMRGADIDFRAVMANKDRKVERFQRAKLGGIARGGYEVIDARARFTGPDTVTANGQTWRFARGAVIATGSVPHVPDLPGLGSVPYWTSDDVMRIAERPSSLLVLGSGAIGLELATFFARMGSRVDLLSRRPLLADLDPLLGAELERMLADEPGLTCHTGARLLAVHRAAAAIHLDAELGGARRTLTADAILVATGRTAALDGLDAQAAGVAVANGRIACGPDMRTTNPRVFVAGDATGDELILHVANQEGRVAGLGAAQAPGEHRVERRLRMTAVFTDPPLAEVGLTEARARAAGYEVAAAHARFAETGRAITMDVAHGVWKLVADARSGEILGTQILGPNADDLVHTVAALMYYRGTVRDVLEMPWYHPTQSEVLLSLAREIDAQVGAGTGAK
jgi:pyruvate/2-oxoglutarate dehydrogenase complex dihydrolipoamide dehydrogenase (E3) component